MNEYKLMVVSRVRFFDIMVKFPFISDRLVAAGQSCIEAKLTDNESAQINSMFPNSLRSV